MGMSELRGVLWREGGSRRRGRGGVTVERREETQKVQR